MMSPEIERVMIRRHRNGTIRFDHEGEFWQDDEKRTPPKAPTCLCDSCTLDPSVCPRCEARVATQEVR